jgi:hypothetical protein
MWCKWCGLRETYRPRAGFKNLRTSDAEPKFENYPYNDVVIPYDGNMVNLSCPDVIYPGKLSTPKVNPCSECYEEIPCVNP